MTSPDTTTWIALGDDPQAPVALRQCLAQAKDTTSLFDMAGFARDFSHATREMARQCGWAGA